MGSGGFWGFMVMVMVMVMVMDESGVRGRWNGKGELGKLRSWGSWGSLDV